MSLYVPVHLTAKQQRPEAGTKYARVSMDAKNIGYSTDDSSPSRIGK